MNLGVILTDFVRPGVQLAGGAYERNTGNNRWNLNNLPTCGNLCTSGKKLFYDRNREIEFIGSSSGI
jgi:hypothetical protein